MSMERTTIIGERDAVQAATGEQQEWHDRYAGAMVVAIALVVVSLISVQTVRWFGGLDVITPVGNAASADMRTPGDTLFGTGISAGGPADSRFVPDAQRIDIRSVTPVVTENSADAAITLLRCTGDGPGVPTGAEGIDVTASCPGAAPFVPATMVLGALPHEDFVVLVEPRGPGVVTIAGFRVEYASGVRSATVDAGLRIRVTVADGDVAIAPEDTAPTP